jgi:acyl carrier protein
MEDVKSTVRDYILEDFLPGAKREELTDTTPLISGGILDSLALLKLVNFLEERYNIALPPYEQTEENMNTLDDIAKFVQSKL